MSPKTPTLTTTAVAGPLALGSPISDTAHARSARPIQPDGDPAGGTITFVAYGPNDATCTTVPPSPRLAIAVTGRWRRTDSRQLHPDCRRRLSLGRHVYVATCRTRSHRRRHRVSDPAEDSEIISLQPTISTAQRFVPNDSATITVTSGAGNLAGTVVFKLFTNATCAGAVPAYTSSQIDITTGTGTGLSRTVSSSNTMAYTASGSFSWLVTYTNTNPGHRNVTSNCVEDSSLVIDNTTP